MRNLKYILFVVLVLALVCGLCACGKKASPKPPRYDAPPAVKSLAIEDIENDVFTLAWNTPTEKGFEAIKSYNVYMEREAIATLCITCAPKFVLVGNTRQTSFSISAEKGYRYIFKLNALGQNGLESGDSNFAIYQLD